MTVLAESHLSGTTPSPAQYRAELRRLLRRLDGLEDGLDREVAETLRQMQRDLQAALAEASEGTQALLRLSQEGLDDLTARAAARWGSAITDATGQAVTLGAEITVGPIDRAFGGQIRGITQSATTDLLGIVSGFSTDLVQGATLDLRRRIRGELSSVLAGARTPGDAARLIGRNLTSANHFSTVYARARAITVTELGRVSALAGQKSQEDLTRALGQAGGFATVAKRWINAHLPGARPDHLQAEADYAETGRYGPIPIDATYMIGGFPALYPHDPALPASQSVSCHCVSVTVLPCGPFKLREAVNADGDTCMIDPMRVRGTSTLKLSEQQWATLDPEGIDSAARSKVRNSQAKNSLSTSTDGKTLMGAVDNWVGTGYPPTTKVTEMRSAVGNLLKGRKAVSGIEQQTDVLLRALRDSPLTPPRNLYRGVNFNGSTKDILTRLQVGSDHDWNLTSFTTDRKVMGEFARRGEGTAVSFTVRGMDQSLPIEVLSQMPQEHEWIAGGRFRVTSVTETRSGISVLLEQVAGL